jgi:F0F1-type ATP synthase assembly protein I
MSEEPETPKLPTDEEIEARFSKIKENLNMDLDDVDPKLHGILENTAVDRLPDSEHDEYATKLADIDAKIKQAKANKASTEPKKDSVSGSLDPQSSVAMGMGLSLAYTIIGSPIVGYGIGLLINKVTGTQGWQIWLTLIGFVIGLGYVVIVQKRHEDRF